MARKFITLVEIEIMGVIGDFRELTMSAVLAYVIFVFQPKKDCDRSMISVLYYTTNNNNKKKIKDDLLPNVHVTDLWQSV